jgi:outer membrane biosynthesis protein TonB
MRHVVYIPVIWFVLMLIAVGICIFNLSTVPSEFVAEMPHGVSMLACLLALLAVIIVVLVLGIVADLRTLALLPTAPPAPEPSVAAAAPPPTRAPAPTEAAPRAVPTPTPTPTPTAPPPTAKVTEEAMVVCGNCGALIPETSSRCPNCNAEFEE